MSADLLKRPNVLLVFSDQEQNHLNWAALHTPNQDRLREAGVTFLQAYTSTPQCSPARASLLTGMLPCENRVEANVDNKSTGLPLSRDITNIGGYFKKAEYNTGYFGKWHLGSLDNPVEYGFDTAVVKEKSKDKDKVVAQKAAEWIREQNGTPWFACVSINNPHDVYQISKKHNYPVREGITLPKSLKDDLTQKPSPQKQFMENDQGRSFNKADEYRWKQYRSWYCESIEDADHSLGIILDALDQLNCWKDTLIIYTSDHGDLSGAHGMPFKGPCMYEELINIPLYLTWKGKLPGGITSNCLAAHIDIVPTICKLIDVRPDYELNGKNLLDSAVDAAKGHESLFLEYTAKQQWFNPIKCIREGDWKLVHYINEGDELYNLADDPDELNNLAEAETFKEIKLKLFDKLQKKFNL